MQGHYLEVTFRQGKLLAAYLYLPRAAVSLLWRFTWPLTCLLSHLSCCPLIPLTVLNKLPQRTLLSRRGRAQRPSIGSASTPLRLVTPHVLTPGRRWVSWPYPTMSLLPTPSFVSATIGVSTAPAAL